MRIRNQLAILAITALLGGCASEFAAFEEAKAANTLEAYQAFLTEYPDGVNKAAAVERIDNMEWTVAESENTAEAYEGYMSAHPDGRHLQDAQLAAPKLAWQVADYSGDKAQVEGFLEKYGRSAYAKKGEARLALLELGPKHLEVGPTRLEEGGKNRWTVAADVKNVGQVDVITAEFRVAWRNGDGRVSRSKEWFLVVEKSDRYDAADELVAPLVPGETRPFTFSFRRSEAADDWVADVEHIQIGLVDLKTAG
jgi:hypothetical protein